MDDKLTIGWRWQDFGSGPMLVTDGRGAQVVLTAQLNRAGGAPFLATRDNDTGVLRRLDAEKDRELMAAIVGAGLMLNLLKSIRDGKMVRDPLDKGSTIMVDLDDASSQAEALLGLLGIA